MTKAGNRHARRFLADGEGKFISGPIRSRFYPIPHDGPVGRMIEAQGRHPYRPAHVHFMIAAPGYRTLVTHLFVDGDKYLDSDVVFGVKDSLVRALNDATAGSVAGGRTAEHDHAVMRYDFALAPAFAEEAAV